MATRASATPAANTVVKSLGTAKIDPAWLPPLANASLDTMATKTIKGNATAGVATPTDLTTAALAGLFGTPTGTKVLADDGTLKIPGATGLLVEEGANKTSGVATLIGGTATVTTTKVTANSRIQLTGQADNAGTPGWQRVSARTPATSFVITSSNPLDTSDVAWVIIEPA